MEKYYNVVLDGEDLRLEEDHEKNKKNLISLNKFCNTKITYDNKNRLKTVETNIYAKPEDKGKIHSEYDRIYEYYYDELVKAKVTAPDSLRIRKGLSTSSETITSINQSWEH